MRKFILLVAALIAAGAAPPVGAATTRPAAGSRPRWEYASLLTSARLCKWTSPQADLLEEGARGYAKLYADLGGEKPVEKVSLVDLLNVVGSQGWELVAIDGGEGPHQYLFKRAAE